MKRSTWFVGGVLIVGSLLSGKRAESAGEAAGDATRVYGPVPADQVEFLSTPDRIMSAVSAGAPSAIWEALEHGEKVECLQCISAVSPLLYNSNGETREIAAWWLRRRIFGVFGPGEVYEQTANTLKSDPNPTKRARAAAALGEFLVAPGHAFCGEAIRTDSDPDVRAAAALALGRLNSEAGGALSIALGDRDSRVKLAALKAAGRIMEFKDNAAIAKLVNDSDSIVRRRAIEVLGSHRVRESVGSVMALAKSDADENVRIAACHALGKFGDASARATLESIASSDASGLVRDQAQIALRRL